jgi:MGT family glycosyltransferase
MSNLIFCAPPLRGHVGPTVPIARELLRRGHRILYLTYGEMAQRLRGWGLPAEDCARLFGVKDPYAGAAAAEMPTMQEHLAAAFAAAQDGWEHFRAFFEEKQPDLVLLDELSLGPQYACERLGMPFASTLITLPVRAALGQAIAFLHSDGGPTRSTFELVRAMRLFRQAAGIPRKKPDPTNYSDLLSLVFTSREFHPEGESFEPHFVFVGACIEDERPGLLPGPLPAPLPAPPPERTHRILVSLGTVYNRRVDLYRIFVDAFRGCGFQVLLAIGEEIDPKDLGEIPEGFEIRATFPQTRILPSVDAFVTHGGLGSVSEALYFDRPLLVLPQAVDQHLNAERVAALGAGLVLSPGQVTAENLRRNLRALLDEPRFAAGARTIGESLRQAGGFRRAADAVEQALKRTAGPGNGPVAPSAEPAKP